jgi:hypothetical protein
LKSTHFFLRNNDVRHTHQNSFKHSKDYHNYRKEKQPHLKIFKIIIGIVLLFTLTSIYKLYEEILVLKRNHLENKFRHVINFDKDIMCIEDVHEKLTFVSGKLMILEGAKDHLVKFKDEELFLRIKREVSVYNYLKEKWEVLSENLRNEELLLTEVDFVNFETKDDIIKVSYEENNFIFPNIQSVNFDSKVQLNSIYLTSAQLHCINSNEKRLNDIVDFQIPYTQKVSKLSDIQEMHSFTWM